MGIHFPSQCLSFLICKMWVIAAVSSEVCSEDWGASLLCDCRDGGCCVCCRGHRLFLVPFHLPGCGLRSKQKEQEPLDTHSVWNLLTEFEEDSVATKLSSRSVCDPIARYCNMSCVYGDMIPCSDSGWWTGFVGMSSFNSINLSQLSVSQNVNKVLNFKRIQSTMALNNRLSMHLKYKSICTQLFRNKSNT